MLTREQKRESLSLYRLESDDPWGDTLTHWFAVADTLYHMGEELPYEWHYRHSPLCNGQLEHFQHGSDGQCNDCGECTYPDVEYIPYMDAGDLGAEMLTYAGRVLDRYARILDRAGRSY